jgi:hypothetical protein
LLEVVEKQQAAPAGEERLDLLPGIGLRRAWKAQSHNEPVNDQIGIRQVDQRHKPDRILPRLAQAVGDLQSKARLPDAPPGP